MTDKNSAHEGVQELLKAHALYKSTLDVAASLLGLGNDQRMEFNSENDTTSTFGI